MVDEKIEYYSGLCVTPTSVYSDVIRAQTFTVGTVGNNYAFSVGSVLLKLSKGTGTVPDVIVGIQATAGGSPILPHLCSGLIPEEDISTDSGLHMVSITGLTLLPDTTYAIVAETIGFGGAPPQNLALEYRDNNLGTYSAGSAYYSTDGGSEWTKEAGADTFYFEIWGGSVGIPAVDGGWYPHKIIGTQTQRIVGIPSSGVSGVMGVY